jgi:peptidoglycan hydrolase-like protein with peptidoglycan-binding domain
MHSALAVSAPVRQALVRQGNPGQPTIKLGAKGAAVRRLQRALRRTANLGVAVDGNFNSHTETAVKQFQQSVGLPATGVVGRSTWNALPNGGPMPLLLQGSTGAVVRQLQAVLGSGAAGQWGTTPGPIDGIFGPRTRASVIAFQAWAHIGRDGIVGDQTWAVSLRAASATLESTVGLQFVIG